LKLWPQMSGGQAAKLASSFSLVLLAAIAWADSFRALDRQLATAKSASDFKEIVRRHADLVNADDRLAEAALELGESVTISDFRRMVMVRAAAEAPADASAAADAKRIKSSPLYRDPGVQEQSNWLDGAIKRLLDLLPKRSPNANIRLPQTAIPTWIVPIMWFLLGAIVLVFGYFVFRHFSWKRALTRKAKAMLEEDEPERTLDEWLSLADEHAASGRYREAVRAMYLSCLLKFDEAGIARFIRGETNWEHLARISASPKKPASIDFRQPTQTFDRIWYGFHVKGQEDVDLFRSWYQQITEALRTVPK